MPTVAVAIEMTVFQLDPCPLTFSDEANQGRYWEIEGFARVPCGGTHLKRTGEIGPVTLKRVNIGKGKERIEIRVADLLAK